MRRLAVVIIILFAIFTLINAYSVESDEVTAMEQTAG